MDLRKKKILAAAGKRAAEIALEMKNAGERAIIVMPNCEDSALIERIRDCGVELVISPGELGLRGAQALAREMRARMDEWVLM